jgi:hypothetical protein
LQEDLDEDMVLEAIALWESRDKSLDGTIYMEKQVAGSSKNSAWKNCTFVDCARVACRRRNFQLTIAFTVLLAVGMLVPSGEMLPSREAIPKHVEALTAITLWQDNPKTKNTMSFDRYEKYKAATTFKEMLDLGAKR